jgi:hypothetical protein
MRRGWAYLRELRGDDEESVRGSETLSAIALLDRLLVAVTGAAVAPGEAEMLCAADRDRLLAAIYEGEIGARITASPRCPACDMQFDLDFTLAELIASVDLDHVGRAPRDTLEVGDAVARVPTGADEIAASQSEDPVGVLAARCCVQGHIEPGQLAEALADAAPTLDLELDAACPGCGQVSPLSFNIQDYLLRTLQAEGTARAREIHVLARSYGWSLAEIQSLPRERRRRFVELVEREAGAR